MANDSTFKMESSYGKLSLPSWLELDPFQKVKWISSDGAYICLDIDSNNEIKARFKITFIDLEDEPRQILCNLNYVEDYKKDGYLEGKIFSIKSIPSSLEIDLRYLIERSIDNQGDLTVSSFLINKGLQRYSVKKTEILKSKKLRLVKNWSITLVLLGICFFSLFSYFCVITSNSVDMVGVIATDAIVKDFTTSNLDVLVDVDDEVKKDQIIAKIISEGLVGKSKIGALGKVDAEGKISTNKSIIESKKRELTALNASLKSASSDGEKNRFKAQISKVESDIAELKGESETLKKELGFVSKPDKSSFQSGCDCTVYNDEGAVITLIPNDAKKYIELAFDRAKNSSFVYDGKIVYFKFDGDEKQKGVLKKIHKNQNERVGLDSKFWSDSKYDIYYIIPDNEIKGGNEILGKSLFIIIYRSWDDFSNLFF